ncbi:kinase-like domain-containing protein [Mycena floridula]|nr:kinase-like domain-containing protein [Mycena floridula]
MAINRKSAIVHDPVSGKIPGALSGAGPRTGNLKELRKLTTEALNELSNDMQDDMMRRAAAEQSSVLPDREDLPAKHNEARQALALLSPTNFERLSIGVNQELARRFPSLTLELPHASPFRVSFIEKPATAAEAGPSSRSSPSTDANNRFQTNDDDAETDTAYELLQEYLELMETRPAILGDIESSSDSSITSGRLDPEPESSKPFPEEPFIQPHPRLASFKKGHFPARSLDSGKDFAHDLPPVLARSGSLDESRAPRKALKISVKSARWSSTPASPDSEEEERSSPCSIDEALLTGAMREFPFTPKHNRWSETDMQSAYPFPRTAIGEGLSPYLIDKTFDSPPDSASGSDAVSRISAASSSDHSSNGQLTVSETSEDPEADLEYYYGQDLTGELVKLETFPFASGAAADVYRGQIKHLGSLVAIKILRRSHDDPLSTRRLYEAANNWNLLSHDNVLPFLGMCHDIGRSPALISPMCSSGTIRRYLKAVNKSPEEKLDMIIGISKGLTYLHAHGIVHGNLSTTKILIDASGVPVIGSYGIPSVIARSEYDVRFAAPECHFAEDSQSTLVPTTATDVYSLSMVVIEILSGLLPYHHLSSDHALLLYLISGGRPDRETFDFTDDVWSLMTQMWNQLPSFRPQMEAVVQRLILLKTEGSKEDPLPEPEVDEDLDDQDENTSDITGRVWREGEDPFSRKGNSNLYRGQFLRANGKKIGVAIKMMRISDARSSEAFSRRLKHEAERWSRLNHPNLLPFLGTCDEFGSCPALVSPFYQCGDIRRYLVTHPIVDRAKMILSIASGVEYLHAKDVVHGNLKPQNILIDKRGGPCICDFGISRIAGTKGTPEYMAPELFLVVDSTSQDRVAPTTTKSSDVFSFGLLVLEILTGQPLKRRPKRPVINSKDYLELCPKRSDYSLNVSDRLWYCLSACWRLEPQNRLSMKRLILGTTSSLGLEQALRVEN